MPTNEDTTNLFDFTDHLHDPGTDPPLTDTLLFPDRLGRCLNFWKSINAPTYIITALEEGIDIGLVPDIEDLLPLNGINKRNMKWENPEHLEAAAYNIW